VFSAHGTVESAEVIADPIPVKGFGFVKWLRNPSAGGYRRYERPGSRRPRSHRQCGKPAKIAPHRWRRRWWGRGGYGAAVVEAAVAVVAAAEVVRPWRRRRKPRPY